MNMVGDEVNDDVQVVIASPFIHLTVISKLVNESSKIFLSAQTCSEHESGAYTGETSATMIKSTGATHVILGHSERRGYFNETNEQLAKKADTVLAHNLTPIFCCGESLDVREGGNHFSFVTNQLTESIFHLSADDFSKLVIAYEPIWAIGTGVTASAEQAQEMHAEIRKHIAAKYGDDVAENTSILYGGSCKPSNAKEIFSKADVDGGLIGGAALKSRDFVDIIKSF